MLSSNISIWALGLSIFSLYSTTAGYFAPEECVEDDVLLSLREWIADAGPFCRDQLGVNDITHTIVLPTSRTTVTEHRTNAVTTKKEGTTTVPSATITISGPTVDATGSASASIKISKRAPVPTAAVQFYRALPFARNIRDGVAPDALISSVSSGCACLYLETQTVQVFSIPKTTRTLTANARQTIVEYSNTLLSGVTTEIALGTPSIPSTFISIPSIPSSSRVVSSPFTNLTLPSTISISTTSLSLNSSIPLPTPTLPSSGFSVSIGGDVSATRSFNLSTPISSIPISSTPGVSVPSLSIPTLSNISTPTSSILSVSVPSLTVPTLLNISTSVSGSPTFPTLANLTSFSSIILSTGTVRTPSVLNLTSIPSTPPLSSVNITRIIGSTGLSISIPSSTKPVDPFNTTRIIGPTIPLSPLSFTVSSSPNITRVIGSTGFPLSTPSFSAGVSSNVSVNASVTRGPTAPVSLSAAPTNLRNFTELSSSCSSLGLLFCSGTTPTAASPSVSVTVITSTSIFVVTSILSPVKLSSVVVPTLATLPVNSPAPLSIPRT